LGKREVKIPLKTTHKIGAAFAGVTLLVILGVGLSFWAFRQIDEAARAREHARMVIDRANDLLSELKDAETGERGYIITGNETFLEPYLAVRDQVSDHLRELRLLAVNSATQKHLVALGPLLEARMAVLAQDIQMRRNQDLNAATALVNSGKGKLLMDSIRVEMQAFIQINEDALAEREAQFQSDMRHFLIIMAVFSLGTLLLALLFAYLLYRDSRHRLHKLVHLETRHLLEIQQETGRQLQTANAELQLFRNVDITARKQAETELGLSSKQLQRLLEYSPVILYALKFEGEKIKPCLISENITRLLGYTLAECMSCDWWYTRLHPEDCERVAASFSPARTDETSRIEYRFLHKDGSTRWVDDQCRLIRDLDGRPLEFIGSWTDITDRKLLEIQLHQAQKMQAIGTLAGGIAHDFNNILTAIGGHAELASMALPENDPVHQHLEVVLQATQRAIALVRQILTFSRQQRVERKVISLESVVDEVLDLLRATLPATIEFETSFATDTPDILADASQIHQIIMNLGTNALYAMKGQSGRLTFKLENFFVDADLVEEKLNLQIGHYVRLSVSDTGCGMDEATLARIFEPFFTTKPVGDGTGLGLSVVYGIMQSHDGTVTAYSHPGNGTTFHLYFPAYLKIGSTQIAEPTEAPRGQGERILYVDDEEVLADLGKLILERLGYIVSICTNPVMALDSVRAAPDAYDLVITDQTMPGLTGTRLAEQIQAIRSNLPIILTTGNIATLTPWENKAVGYKAVLLKPPTFKSLGTLVHRVLTEANHR